MSRHGRKADLDRQVARLSEWAVEAGGRVVWVKAEIDRLGRVNVELVEAALSTHSRRLVVLDDGEVTDDLVPDVVEVLTSLCARVYGGGSADDRAGEALEAAEHG